MTSRILYFRWTGNTYRPLVPWRQGATWLVVRDTHIAARSLASRHYSHPTREECDRKSVLPPGRKLCLIDEWGKALAGWVHQLYRADRQRGLYLSIFRNESEALSSALIVEATECARHYLGAERCFTFVDPRAIVSNNPGYCFKRAGWQRCGTTGSGLLIFENLP